MEMGKYKKKKDTLELSFLLQLHSSTCDKNTWKEGHANKKQYSGIRSCIICPI